MKHFTQPRNAILRETDSNPSSCSPNPSSMKQKSSPSSSRKHKSSKENAPPSNFNLMSEYSASFATKPPLPAAAKSRSPLPPRPPSSNLNPLKRKLNMEVVPENLGSGFSDSGVKVVVRMRPLNKDEEEEMIVQKISSDTLSINGQSLTFDSVADTEATQLDIFQLVGAPLVENCLAGFNSSVFAYGQTGSGKTYTIWGPTNALSEEKQSNSQVGLTPRVFECLFARINEEQIKHADKQLQYQCRCSFLEIYNEQITDLLDPSQKNLQIREDVKCGVYVENLTEVDVWTLKDVTQLLMKGLSSRRIGATSINGESSRSHSVFTCMVESKCKSMADGMSSFKTSRINLVDLAGSERQKITGAAGDRLKEAGNINRSLSQLGNLINILAEVSQTGKQRHIPYRDSRLTFLLQESLGGNAKLAMICAISPAQSCKSETFSTLRFAQRAKAIKNKAVVNEVMQDDVNFLREVIRQLKDELHRMKANGNSSTSNGCYSTAWNARRSLNLLKLSLNRPLTLPHVEDDSDEEMEIDEENVEQSCHQVDLKLSRPEAKHPISGSSSMAIRDGHLVEPQLHASISGSAKNQDPKDTDLHMEEETCKQVENHESMNVDLASSESPPSEEKTLLGCSVRALENNESADNITVSADSSNHTPNETVSGVAPFDLGLVSCDVSPVLKSPTPSVSPRVSKSRKSLKTSFMLSASHKELNDDDIKTGSDIKNTSSVRSMQSGDLTAPFGRRRNDLIKSSADLAASLHRGLEILESQRQGSAMRRSLFRSSFKPVDFKPILPIVKVDVGVQTCFQDNEKLDEYSVAVLCSHRASQLEVRENEGRSLQLIPVDGSESADKLKVQVPKVVEKVLAGAIRREMALEEFSAKQASEITQLNRLVQQYKHERECNAIIGQTRDDKIRRLESLMDGILPVKDFMEEEFLALKHEHKLLEDKYDNHVELLSTKIELKRVQDELEQYHNFFDMGERDVLLEEIQDLRNQLRFYVDSLPPSTRKRSSLLELTYSREPNSGPPPLCAIPESTTDSSREQLERERFQWIEAESKWISLAEELKSELEASRTCAEKRRRELEAEKKCAEELKQAMQMAMEGHARMLEQYAELQEKHIAMLARHRKIQEGVGDVKRAAARAGVRGAESKFINALAAEVSALKVEREREKQHLRDENKGLQAQLRDTAEAVQAAGELLVRLKETEEAFAAAQKRALVAEKETEKANKQISKLKKRHEKEISALNQRLAESRLPKEALQPIYDGSNTAKHGPKEELHRWEEQVEPFFNGEDGELSKLVEPSWFSGYDRCNI